LGARYLERFPDNVLFRRSPLIVLKLGLLGKLARFDRRGVEGWHSFGYIIFIGNLFFTCGIIIQLFFFDKTNKEMKIPQNFLPEKVPEENSTTKKSYNFSANNVHTKVDIYIYGGEQSLSDLSIYRL